MTRARTEDLRGRDVADLRPARELGHRRRAEEDHGEREVQRDDEGGAEYERDQDGA